MKITAALFVGFACTASAATVNTSAFSGLTDGAVSTAGLADWGFVSERGALNNGLFNGSGGSYNDLDYGSLDNSTTILTTVNGSPSIGNVTVTEGQGADGATDFSSITFGGTQAYGGFRNVAPSEDVFTINFYDLGVGTFDITLYLGHSATNRNFRIDYDVSDGGGASDKSDSTSSGAISGLGSTIAFSSGVAFTYNFNVTTTTAGSDVALNLHSTSGSSGGGLFAGYTVDSAAVVTPVPEPSTSLLGVLGAFAILFRRRR